MEVNNLGRNKLTESEQYLIAPCGIYCGACDILLGKSRNLAKELHRILNGFNIADVGPFVMGVETDRILEFLNMLEKWSQGSQCPGCLPGGWNPSCLIKACTQEQGFLTCADCVRMPCNRLEQGQPSEAATFLELVTKRYSSWNIENLERIREVGYRQFVDEMHEKVRNGFLTSDVISREMIVTEIMKKMEAG